MCCSFKPKDLSQIKASGSNCQIGRVADLLLKFNSSCSIRFLWIMEFKIEIFLNWGLTMSSLIRIASTFPIAGIKGHPDAIL